MPALPTCPRCGYDLSGQIATWHPAGVDVDGAACPMTGVCSECGLDVSWTRVMRPELNAPPWFFETAKRPVRGLLQTCVRVLWPPTFWKGVGLDTPFRWRRLLIVAALLLLVLRPIDWAIARLSWQLWGPGTLGPMKVADFIDEVLLDLPWPLTEPRLLLCAMVGVCWALMMMALPYTRAYAKVRPRHVLRAAVYSNFWVFILVLIDTLSGMLTSSVTALGAQLLGPGARFWRPPSLARVINVHGDGLLTILLLAYLALYWWCVLKIGWRVDKPWVVWIASGIPALLGAFTAMMLLDH